MLRLVLASVAAVQTQAPDHGRTDPVAIPPERPNVVVVLLDDVGVDMIGAYDEAPVQAPCTPAIDALAAGGVLFRNAYTSPWCSPTRAQLLTGRYAFRTGIGIFVEDDGTSPGLDVGETIVPEALPGYASACVGKWHLAAPFDQGDGQGLDHPRNSGFGSHAGSMYNPTNGFVGACCPPGCTAGQSFDYFDWVKTTDGVQACTTNYMTIDTTTDAIARIQSLPEPWFLYVAYNVAHTPKHNPPPALCQPECPQPPYKCPTSFADGHPTQNKAMIQVLDNELGRFLDRLQEVDPDAWVFLLGDNGTTKGASEGPPNGCFDPLRVKGTPYEGGINVPLIVRGPGVVPGEVGALVSSTDLFATLMELCGGTVAAEDSVSMVPYLFGRTDPLRTTVYAEAFQPNGLPFAPLLHERAVRDAQHKLIRRTDATFAPPLVTDELYDLLNDPCESQNLLIGPLTPAQQAAYAALDAELVALGVG